MNLKTVIDLNIDLAPKAPMAISMSVGFIGAVIATQSFGTSTAGMVIYLFLIAWIMVFAIIPLNHVFSRSLFGEEAYRYMLLPVSFRKMVIGKICAGAEHCSVFCILTVLFSYYTLIKFFGTGGDEYGIMIVDVAAALINLHHMISDNVMTTAAVMFIIGAAPIAALLESVFISAMILNGVIIKNLMDPRREKPLIAIGIAIVALLGYLAVSLLFIWVPGLFFQNDLAIPQLIIAAILKIGAIYGMARSAAHLLEEKYALN